MPRQNRGFNLVEAAIVLGVVGLVIGGIWIAASSVSRENKRQAFQTVLLDLGQRTRNLWGNQAWPDNGPAYTDITSSIYSTEELTDISTMSSSEASRWDWSAGTHVYKNPAGVYGAITGNATTPRTVLYSVGYLDKADCVWFGLRSKALTPNPDTENQTHIFLPGGANFGYYPADPSFNPATVATWLQANCLDGAVNVITIRTNRP